MAFFLTAGHGVVTAKVSDVLAIGGMFYNEEFAVKYAIEENKFEWNGSAWLG